MEEESKDPVIISLRRELTLACENLTSVQKRCTELKEESRALARELASEQLLTQHQRESLKELLAAHEELKLAYEATKTLRDPAPSMVGVAPVSARADHVNKAYVDGLSSQAPRYR